MNMRIMSFDEISISERRAIDKQLKKLNPLMLERIQNELMVT